MATDLLNLAVGLMFYCDWYFLSNFGLFCSIAFNLSFSRMCFSYSERIWYFLRNCPLLKILVASMVSSLGGGYNTTNQKNNQILTASFSSYSGLGNMEVGFIKLFLKMVTPDPGLSESTFCPLGVKSLLSYYSSILRETIPGANCRVHLTTYPFLCVWTRSFSHI